MVRGFGGGYRCVHDDNVGGCGRNGGGGVAAGHGQHVIDAAELHATELLHDMGQIGGVGR